MDPNTPQPFMCLLEGDDSRQVGGNSATPIPAHNPHVSYFPYPPQNYHNRPHHSYYPPQLSSKILSGSSQNPQHYLPLYYPLTHKESLNVQSTEYLYYTPYYPRDLLTQITFLWEATPHSQLHQ